MIFDTDPGYSFAASLIGDTLIEFGDIAAGFVFAAAVWLVWALSLEPYEGNWNEW